MHFLRQTFGLSKCDKTAFSSVPPLVVMVTQKHHSFITGHHAPVFSEICQILFQIKIGLVSEVVRVSAMRSKSSGPDDSCFLAAWTASMFLFCMTDQN